MPKTLSYSNLSPGQVLLGVIKKVSEQDLTISLPSFMKGFVKRDQAIMCEGWEGSLQDVYVPGEWVQCAVVAVDGVGKRVELSIQPSLTNRRLHTSDDISSCGLYMVSLKSCEEKGFLMDFGVDRGAGEESVGFWSSAISDDLPLTPVPGKCFLVRVKDDFEGGRLIPCEPIKDITALPAVELGSVALCPGHAIFAASSAPNNVNFEIPGVDHCILDDPLGISAKKYYVSLQDTMSSTIRCSPIRDVQNDANNKTLYEHVGRVFKRCAVKNVKSTYGAILQPPEEGDLASLSIFVHIARSADQKTTKLVWVVDGTPVDCKVLDWDPFSRLWIGTTRPVDVRDPDPIALSQIQPGFIAKGTVDRIESYGLLVKFSNGRLRGMCPASHVSEGVVSSKTALMSRFKPGQSFKFRVLEVDASANKCILTRKRSLITSKHPVLASLSIAKPGSIHHGYISAIKPFGLLIGFYGGVRGLMHIGQLKEYDSLEDSFFVGQVLECRVLSARLSSQSLQLALVKDE